MRHPPSPAAFGILAAAVTLMLAACSSTSATQDSSGSNPSATSTTSASAASTRYNGTFRILHGSGIHDGSHNARPRGFVHVV